MRRTACIIQPAEKKTHCEHGITRAARRSVCWRRVHGSLATVFITRGEGTRRGEDTRGANVKMPAVVVRAWAAVPRPPSFAAPRYSASTLDIRATVTPDGKKLAHSLLTATHTRAVSLLLSLSLSSSPSAVPRIVLVAYRLLSLRARAEIDAGSASTAATSRRTTRSRYRTYGFLARALTGVEGNAGEG